MHNQGGSQLCFRYKSCTDTLLHSWLVNIPLNLWMMDDATFTDHWITGVLVSCRLSLVDLFPPQRSQFGELVISHPTSSIRIVYSSIMTHPLWDAKMASRLVDIACRYILTCDHIWFFLVSINAVHMVHYRYESSSSWYYLYYFYSWYYRYKVIPILLMNGSLDHYRYNFTRWLPLGLTCRWNWRCPGLRYRGIADRLGDPGSEPGHGLAVTSDDSHFTNGSNQLSINHYECHLQTIRKPFATIPTISIYYWLTISHLQPFILSLFVLTNTSHVSFLIWTRFLDPDVWDFSRRPRRNPQIVGLCWLPSASLMNISGMIGRCPFFWHAQDHGRSLDLGAMEHQRTVSV